MRRLGMVFTALLLVTALSPCEARAQTTPPGMGSLSSPAPEAWKALRAGLRYKKDAEKAHERGKLAAEKTALEQARHQLQVALQSVEYVDGRLALGEVENLLGNPKEGLAQCRQALASPKIRAEEKEQAAACIQEAIRRDPSLQAAGAGPAVEGERPRPPQ